VKPITQQVQLQMDIESELKDDGTISVQFYLPQSSCCVGSYVIHIPELIEDYVTAHVYEQHGIELIPDHHAEQVWKTLALFARTIAAACLKANNRVEKIIDSTADDLSSS